MTYLLLYFKKIFSIDLRALALMRIGVAVIILTDLAIRATDLEAHYSNMGVLPLHVMFEHTWNPFFLSFHTLSGLWQVQAILFLLAGILAVFLLLGHHTRTATILSWVFMVSLHNRNTLISQGGDDLLRMLLFWAMFMPWGRYYSLDRDKQPANPGVPSPYFSAATAAYIIQICLVYICTAMLKNAPEWRTEGTALYYALSLDQVLMPGGKLIYPYPELLKFLTHFTFYTELLISLLLFIPFYTKFFRLLFVGILAGFHVGISLTLFVGLFYLINFASLAGLLPSETMNWFDKKVAPTFSKIYYRFLHSDFKIRNLIPFSVEVKLSTVSWFTKTRQRRLREIVVLFFLSYVLWWTTDVAWYKGQLMQNSNRWLGNTLRIDQYWGMFAPAVFKDDGWYVYEATTQAGKRLDLNQKGKPPTYDKPASVMALVKNDRWRKYSENYLFVNNTYMRPYYCNYLLRRWNEDHPEDPVTNLEVVYMKEVSQPDYKVPPPDRVSLCGCALATQ